MTRATAHVDGGNRGNPGHYACAVVFYHEETGIGRQEVRYLGDHGTNNDAEYEGLLLALRLARQMGVKRLKIRSDSKLVVEQVLGNWKVKEESLRPYVIAARSLAAEFESCEIKHVPREENVVADALVTALLDEITGRARGSRGPTLLSVA